MRVYITSLSDGAIDGVYYDNGRYRIRKSSSGTFGSQSVYYSNTTTACPYASELGWFFGSLSGGPLDLPASEVRVECTAA